MKNPAVKWQLWVWGMLLSPGFVACANIIGVDAGKPRTTTATDAGQAGTKTDSGLSQDAGPTATATSANGLVSAAVASSLLSTAGGNSAEAATSGEEDSDAGPLDHDGGGLDTDAAPAVATMSGAAVTSNAPTTSLPTTSTVSSGAVSPSASSNPALSATATSSSGATSSVPPQSSATSSTAPSSSTAPPASSSAPPVITQCTPPQADCDSNPATCETDLTSGLSCGESCLDRAACSPAAGASCVNGGCSSEWAAWLMPNNTVADPGTPNTLSYTDNADGSVTDNVTGLVWQQVMSLLTYTQPNAETYCRNLNLAGHKDWRLPTLIELISLVDTGSYSPAINATYFPSTLAEEVWTASRYANNATNYAWYVDFQDGDSYWEQITRNGLARCVR